MSGQGRQSPPTHMILLLASAVLILTSVLWGVPHVEAELISVTQDALTAAGFVVGEVQVSGRDVLVCNADEATLQGAISLVSSLDGVRLVHGSLTCP